MTSRGKKPATEVAEQGRTPHDIFSRSAAKARLGFPTWPGLNGIRSSACGVHAGVPGPGQSCYSLSPTKCARPPHPPFQLEGVLGGHMFRRVQRCHPPPPSHLVLPRVCVPPASSRQSSTLSLEGPRAASSSSQGSWRVPSP